MSTLRTGILKRVIMAREETRMRSSMQLVSTKLSNFIKNRELLHGSLVVLSVAILSVALSMQGWRSRIPAFDLITYHYGIRDFLETGTLLQHGDTGSYGSYKPPGTAWLMLPGVLLLDDPRLTDYVGTAFLHVSTLLGLYLLAKRFFGTACAALTVVLYGLSAHGLFLAGSLWPNGRPDFYIWVVYFAIQWATYRDARYLAIALTVWGLGMYVDMALLPVIFILPVLWFYYKPPLRLAPLLVSGTILFLVWMPYLRFETTRGFADIRSQVFQQPIHPANVKDAWCDPTLTLQSWDGDVEQGAAFSEANLAISSKVSGLVEMLLSNFQHSTTIPEAGLFLLFLTLGGVLFLSVIGTPPAPYFWHDRISLTGFALLLGGLVIGVFVFTADSRGLDGTRLLLVGKLQKAFTFSGLALLGGYWVVSLTDHFLAKQHIQIQNPERPDRKRMLVLSLLIPWFLLLLFAEPGKPERFMWLWTLQCLFLSAFITNMLPQFNVPRFIIHLSQVVVVFLVASNYLLVERVHSWVKNGWSGMDAAEIQVVDAVAEEIQAGGRDEANIGYRMFIYPFMAEYNITNPFYKVGAELDLLFRLRHGVTNLTQCAEGVSPQDEYRIVETRPKPPEWAPKEYFPVDMDEGFHLIGQFGTYQIYWRE
jgi:hypothetical protein